MHVRFKHITLIYAHPKAVQVSIESLCACGIKTSSQTCDRYAHIHVACSTCQDTATIQLNRDIILSYFKTRHPTLCSDLDFFLDKWEIDMKKYRKCKP